MKKITFTCFVILVMMLLPMGFSVAQNNVLKINILSPIVKTLNVSFEHVMGTDKSMQLGFAYTGASIGDTKLSGIQITPEYRFYLSETSAPDGVYMAPYIRYANLSLEVEDLSSKATLSSFGGGLVVGKQWIFKETISLETFLGPSYSSTSLEVDAGSEDDFSFSIFDGFGLRVGVNFGLAF